jgi:hypothetical protein
MADLTITAANVVPSTGTTASGPAGETVTAGMPLYLKSSDSRYWKAQADGTTEEATVAGISINGASAGQPVSFVTEGGMNIGATTAKTTAYMLSATAGGICPQADLVSTNKIVYLGYATATDGTFVVMRRVTGAVV